MNQGPWDRARPRGTNQVPTRRIRAPQDESGPGPRGDGSVTAGRIRARWTNQSLRATLDDPGLRKTNQGSEGWIRTLQGGSRPRWTNQGPVKKGIRAPRDRSGPRRMKQDSARSIRTPQDQSGSRRINQVPAGYIGAGRTNQGYCKTNQDLVRQIRVPQNGSGSRGTNQGPPGRIRGTKLDFFLSATLGLSQEIMGQIRVFTPFSAQFRR